MQPPPAFPVHGEDWPFGGGVVTVGVDYAPGIPTARDLVSDRLDEEVPMTQPPTGAPYGRPISYGGADPQGAPGQYGPAGYGQAGGGRSNYQQPSAPPASVPVAVSRGISGARATTPSVHPLGGASAVPATDRLVRRTAATGSGWIVFVLCGGTGLLLLTFGLKTIIGDRDDAAFGFAPLITGLLLLVFVLVMTSMRTEFDATGIHTRVLVFRRDISWPRSRSDLFVKRPSAPPLLVIFLGLFLIVLAFLAGDAGDVAGVSMSAKAYVRVPRGRAVWLPGLTRRGLLRSTMERRGNAELDRIWAWAVSRGYTQETGAPVRS